jgi:hypothetical protein
MRTTTKSFASFCGPAAISSALGISREEAAARIDAAAGKRHARASSIHTLAKVVGATAELVTPTEGAGTGRVGAGWSFTYRTHRRPTLAAWLRSNPTVEAILRAGYHFVHVRGGAIVEANGLVQPRARVTHVVRLRNVAPTARPAAVTRQAARRPTAPKGKRGAAYTAVSNGLNDFQAAVYMDTLFGVNTAAHTQIVRWVRKHLL